MPWWWTTGVVAQGSTLNYQGMAWAGAGAVAMGVLTLAQRTLFWWPLHPIAFLICNTHMVYNMWFSIFLAWLIKLLVVKFGGYGAFRIARRLFIGMVLGGFLAGRTWSVVDLLTGSVGNSVFAI